MKRLVVLAVLAAICAPQTAQAIPVGDQNVSPTIVAGPQSHLTNYATPVQLAIKGVGIDFLNADIAGHDVRATLDLPANDPRRASRGCAPTGPPETCPLFSSLIVSLGVKTPIRHTEDLETGVYDFFCTLHRISMVGKLVVVNP